MKKNTVHCDRLALQRDKEMSPGARLDWLAAAWEFTRDVQQGRAARKQPTKNH